RKTHVKSRQGVRRIGGENFLELRDAFIAASGFHQRQAIVVADVEVRGIEIGGGVICVNRTHKIASEFERASQIDPGELVVRLERYGGLERWDGILVQTSSFQALS